MALYGVDGAVGKFVRRRRLRVPEFDTGPPLDFDGHVVRITTAPLLLTTAACLDEIATFISATVVT